MDGSHSEALGASSEALRSRVALVLEPGGMTVDGVWWPRSDSLVRELPALDLAIAASLGAGIARFSYVLGAWSDSPRRVRSGSHLIKIGWFSHGAAPDNIDLSLDDYRRVVLKVIPPDTPPGEARSLIDGATVLTSWPDTRPWRVATPADGRPDDEDPVGTAAVLHEPVGPGSFRLEVPAVRELLEELALIEDPRARERAARKLEWRATEWAMAAGRIRWGAHAEALAAAGEPPSPASPPWG
jgi:Family of unknown function (DUF5994)